MQAAPITDERMRRYLLGELTQDEREHFEAHYFGNDEAFAELCVIEEELVDAYVREELAPAQREHFEKFYLITAARRERVAFARSFHAMLASERASDSSSRHVLAWARAQWQALTTRSPRWAVAGVAIVLLISASLLMRDNTLRPNFTALDKLPTANSSELGPATFTLAPRAFEAALPVQTLLLPATARTVQLQFLLDEKDEHQVYRASLRAHTGEEIWRGARLTPVTLATGKVLVCSVPALDLLESEYTLTVSGLRNAEVVLFLDYARRALVQIDPVAGVRTTIAQRGKLIAPIRMALAANGDIFVANQFGTDEGCRLGCGNVIKIDPKSGEQSVISSGGMLGTLHGIALETSGNLLVPSTYENRATVILRIDPRTGGQRVVASGGFLFNPTDLALTDEGEILVVEDRNQEGASTLLRIDPHTGEQSVIAQAGHLIAPYGIALAPNHEIWLADQHAHKVVFLGPEEDSGGPGKILRIDALSGEQTVLFSGQHFRDPSAIAFGGDGAIYIADPNSMRQQRGAIIRIARTTGAQTILAAGEDVIGPVDIAVAPASAASPFVVEKFARQYVFAVRIE